MPQYQIITRLKAILLFFILFWIAACDSSGTSPPVSLTFTESATETKAAQPLIPPTSPTTPTPPPAPGPALPVLAGTPAPQPKEPITPENVDQLVELARWGKGRVTNIKYSLDGRYLAIGTTTGIWLYDADALTLLRFINADGGIDTLAFSADGQTITALVGTTTIVSWDIQTGAEIQNDRISEGYVKLLGDEPRAAASADGSTLVTSGGEYMTLWSIKQRKHLPSLDIEKRLPVNGFALSSTGNRLALRHPQRRIATGLWNVNTGKLLQYLPYDGNGVVAFFHQNSNILIGRQIRSIKTGRQLCAFGEEDDWLISRALSSLDQWVLTEGSGYILTLWNTTTCRPERKLAASHLLKITSAVFSPDDRRLVTGSLDGAVKVWDVQTGDLVNTLEGFWPYISDMAVSSNGKLFFSPGFDIDRPQVFNRSIQIWDIKTGDIIATLKGHKGGDVILELLPDDQTLISQAKFDDFLVWNIETGQLNRSFTEDELRNALQRYFSSGYVLSPDGSKLLTETGGHVLSLSDVKTGEVLFETRLRNLETGEEVPETLAARKIFGRPVFSSNGETIAITLDRSAACFASSSDWYADLIWLWDTKTGELTHQLTNESHNVVSIVFSPDNQLLASGVQLPYLLENRSPSIRFWNVKTGERLSTPLSYNSSIRNLFITDDGNLLISSASDGTIRFWGVPSE